MKKEKNSKYTIKKQKCLKYILNTHVSIVYKITQNFKTKYKYPGKIYYYFIDLNSDKGYQNIKLNKEGKTEIISGSPIIFKETAIQNDLLEYRAMFYEKEEEKFLELKNYYNKYQPERPCRVSLFDNYNTVNHIQQKFFNEDHAKQLEKDMFLKEKHNFGLLYCDPYGISINGGFNLELLEKLSNNPRYKNINFLINYPSHTLKRVKNAFPNKKEWKGFVFSDLFKKINKDYWFIKEPIGQSGWTFILGTNYKNFPEFKKIKLVSIKSYDGIRYISAIENNKKEGKKIYDLMDKKEVKNIDHVGYILENFKTEKDIFDYLIEIDKYQYCSLGELLISVNDLMPIYQFIKILKLCGLANPGNRTFVPSDTALKHELIIKENGKITFNKEKCASFIFIWLIRKKIYNKFYNIFEIKELNKFINEIYDEYI